MTTIHVPYSCDNCGNKFDVTMKAGEPTWQEPVLNVVALQVPQ